MPRPADAITQTLVQADVAWAFGLIDLAKKRVVETMQNEVVDLVRIPGQALGREYSHWVLLKHMGALHRGSADAHAMCKEVMSLAFVSIKAVPC